MKIITALLALGLVTGATGCAIVRAPAAGALYTDVQSNESVTNGHLGKKMGEACVQSILGLVATGDASAAAAAKNGGIHNVTHVDEYANNILGIIGKYCTRVYGD